MRFCTSTLKNLDLDFYIKNMRSWHYLAMTHFNTLEKKKIAGRKAMTDPDSFIH